MTAEIKVAYDERGIPYLFEATGEEAVKVNMALEKQIRKKVIEDCMCPNCGADVTNQADNDYLFEHCYHCGQALDWSDKE